MKFTNSVCWTSRYPVMMRMMPATHQHLLSMLLLEPSQLPIHKNPIPFTTIHSSLHRLHPQSTPQTPAPAPWHCSLRSSVGVFVHHPRGFPYIVRSTCPMESRRSTDQLLTDSTWKMVAKDASLSTTAHIIWTNQNWTHQSTHHKLSPWKLKLECFPKSHCALDGFSFTVETQPAKPCLYIHM